MVFNTTFNNISVIPWQSVLLVEDSGKTTYLSQVTKKLSHVIHLALIEIQTRNISGCCKSNYHTITATMASTSIGVSVPRLILVILICPMTTIYLNNFWTIVMAEILFHHNGRQGWHFENKVTNHSSNLTFVCCIFISDKNVLDAHPWKWFEGPTNLNSVDGNQAEPCG